MNIRKRVAALSFATVFLLEALAGNSTQKLHENNIPGQAGVNKSEAVVDGSLDIGVLTQQVIDQMKNYHQKFGTTPWNYQIAAKDLSYQVGSLCKLIMQLNNERYRYDKSDEKLKAEIGDELADILSLVLLIAHELKIDLNQAWTGMLQADQQKFVSRSTVA
jgi:NTP pyrophosphatase (non-canonical NTP hydrolase)